MTGHDFPVQNSWSSLPGMLRPSGCRAAEAGSRLPAYRIGVLPDEDDAGVIGASGEHENRDENQVV